MVSNTTKDEEKSTIILSSNFAYDLFAWYMREQGWTIRIRDEQGEDPDRSIEEVWGKDGVPAAVHYMDNQRLWTRYLWIHGSNIWPIVEELIPRFGGPTGVELYDGLAEVETRGDLIVGIIQLAIGWADAFDADVMEVFKHHAKHEDSRVRSAVVQGLLFNKWPQGLPILKDLAENDESPDVRDFADKVYENVKAVEEDFAVLKEHVDHGRFTRFAEKQGWKLQHTFPQSSTEPFFEEVWSTADEQNAIHYVDDPRFTCRFLRIRGPELRNILFEVARKLGFYDDDELVTDAADAEEHDEAIKAILRLGVGLRRFRPDALATYAAYLQHSNTMVRMAAIQAIAYHHWAEAQKLLADVVANDSDEAVRDFAKPMIETSRRKHGHL